MGRLDLEADPATSDRALAEAVPLAVATTILATGACTVDLVGLKALDRNVRLVSTDSVDGKKVA